MSLVWHSGYREKHRTAIVLRMLASLPLDILRGMVRLLPPFRPLRYTISGIVRDTLLIVPSECAGQSYVASGPGDAILVYGPIAGTNMDLDIVRPFFHLLRAVSSALREEKVILGLMWLSWIVSLRWLQYRALDLTLSSLIAQHRIKKLGCIHEMHAHSRIVWDVARRHGASGHTVQHAAFSEGKRWLFPQPQESVPTPDVFYVHHAGIIELLSPYYPHTTFRLGSSSRYSRGTAKPLPRRPSYYLFVTALPSFDNAIVKEARSRISLPARLRLHPAVSVPVASLEEDLAGAIAVIGLGSTVLQEAAALGIPVVQLTHPDYLEYLDLEGIPGVVRIHHSDFSEDTLKVLPSPDAHEAQRRFGASHDEVTYRRLFL